MLKKYFILLCFLAGLQQATMAQLNYPASSFQISASTYTDLGTTGSAITTANTDNANSSATPIGFTFTYNRTAYTDFILNTNGVIRFGTVAPSTANLFTAVQVTGAGTGGIFNIADSNMIAPFQLDLIGATGCEYRVSTTGSAGSRVCTIQWKNVTENTSAVPTQYSNFSFQVKLYEGSNVIEFIYGPATASTNTSAFKSAQIGLKGTSVATANMVTITKGSTQAWTIATAAAGNYVGNNFNYGNSNGVARPLPVAGTRYRFLPIYSNDMAVRQVYSLGKLPIPFAVPHTVKAAIRNTGTSPLTSFSVILSVSGANSFIDSVVISNLNPNVDTTISFAAFSPTNLGNNVVKVFGNIDQNAFNDTGYYNQIVNLNTYNYADPLIPPAGGVGFTGGTGDFVAKFPYSGTNSINQIGVNFNTGGNNLKVGIWDTSSTGAPGALLWSSPSFLTTAGLNTIPVNPPVPISGTFFVGVIQTGTVNAAFSYQNEVPIRGQTFYYTAPTGGTTWTDFLTTNSNFRFMIEPRLQLANDLGVTEITDPCTVFPLGQGSVNPSADFYNYGSNTQFGIKVRTKIYDATNTLVYNDSNNIAFILPGQSVTLTFPRTFSPTVQGTYTIQTWTELSGDGDLNNDTAVKVINVLAPVTGFSGGTRVQFDGVNDNVSIANSAATNPSTNFTIESWIRPSSLVSTGTIYSKDSTVTDSSLTITLSGLTPIVNMKTTSGYHQILSTVNAVLLSWTHIALTYDGTNLKMYVNGELGIDTALGGSVVCKNGPTYLGMRAGATNPFSGGMENFMYWNTARTQSQIRLGMHYKVPTMSSTNLLTYYRFDEGVNQSLLSDASGNCHVGVMNNFDLTAAWFLSSLPLDTNLGTSVTFSNSSIQSFTNKNVSLRFQNLSGSHEVVVHYFRYAPIGFTPDTVIATSPKTFHPRHWAIYKYGNATYDSCYGTFQLLAGNLGSAANGNDLYLSVRDNGASGLWTVGRNPADTLSVAASTVSFWLPATQTFARQYGIASAGTANPLPVKYAWFKGTKTDNGAQLSWATTSEINARYFVVERSIDGKNFEAIGKLFAQGNSQTLVKYEFLDNEFFKLGASQVYYRLNQIDADGAAEYSSVVLINEEATSEVLQAMLPNPFSDKLQIVLNTNQSTNIKVSMFDMSGKMMLAQEVSNLMGTQQIDLEGAGKLPAGVYFLKLQYNEKEETVKVLKF